MTIYIFTAIEHAKNVKKCNSYTEFEYSPFKDYCNLVRLYINLEENDVRIYDEKLNFKCKGKLNFQESRYLPEPKLIYDLESNNDFLGGNLILEKQKAEIIQSGSGLYYLNAYRGSVKRATKYDV
jgi:hypothetical protein